MDMKRCPTCDTSKELTDFHRNASNPDGLQKRCKRCHVAVNRESQARLRERTTVEERREVNRARRDKHYAKRRAGEIDWRRRNRHKHLAHKAVYRAIARGELVRPEVCEGCCKPNTTIHAHHADYSAPLDVKWLCPPCHAGIHAEERLAESEAA